MHINYSSYFFFFQVACYFLNTSDLALNLSLSTSTFFLFSCMHGTTSSLTIYLPISTPSHTDSFDTAFLDFPSFFLFLLL